MPVTLLSMENMVCSYQGHEVLTRITLDVAAGDYVGIVGPNGSGKSTLIRTILGLLTPDSGQVTLFGVPVASFREWRRIGYLPQSMRTFNPAVPATVEEVIRLGLLPHKRFPRRVGGRSDTPAVERALEALGITGIRRKLIGELSGGQQQRALLARAIVGRPELLILDEPTTALDPETRERFYTLLGDLNRHEGTTIILVTHDTGSIGSMASRLVYVDRRIIFNGTLDDFCHSVEMTAFFGEASQHLICHRH
jgi:zinc transport system ATP-binding protein